MDVELGIIILRRLMIIKFGMQVEQKALVAQLIHESINLFLIW